MTVSFDLDLNDLLGFQEHYVKTDPVIRKRVDRMRYIISAFLLAVLVVDLATSGWRPNYVFLAFVVLFLLYMIFVYPRRVVNASLRQARKLYAKPENANFMGETKMTFTDVSFTASRAGLDSTVPWDKVIRVDETERYLFIYESTLTSYVIPKYKLTAREVEGVEDFIRRYATDKTVK